MDQSKQTIRNFIFNALSLIISVVLGLLYTPYLVRTLGIVMYGIVPLALIINQYVNVLTGSLTGSLTRFYSVSFQQRNYGEASMYLSSSFVAITVISTCLLPVFIWIAVRIDHLFNIPADAVNQAKLLFSFTLVSFILSLYSSLYNITLYAMNRLDLLNVIKIIRIVTKVIFTVVFFELIKKDIAYIGYANALSELVVLLLSIYYFRITTDKQVSLSVKKYQKAGMISIFSMTIWVVIHQLGDTGLYRIDNILVNHFWSTRESGILGALSEFGSYVTTLVAVISSLFGPLILIAYSDNDHATVKKLTLDSALLVGIITGLLAGLLIGFAKPIIGIWLGHEYESYSNWFILKQIYLPFYAAAGVFAFVYRAWNRVIFPALMTLVLGVLNLLISYLVCAGSLGDQTGILTMLLIAVCFMVLQSYGLNSFYFCRLYKETRMRVTLYIFIKIALSLLATYAISRGITSIFPVTTVGELILASISVSVAFSFLGYFFLLDQLQKQMVRRYISSFNKYLPL